MNGLAYLFFILAGLKFNLVIAASAFCLGLMVAVVLTYIEGAYGGKPGASIRVFSYAVTGIPPLVLLSITYWVLLPALGVRGNPLLAAVIAFSIRTSAFQLMILASSIRSISNTQMESGLSLGLSVREVFRYVLIPQALMLSAPSLTNEFASLLKESTQALAIGVLDALARARYVTISVSYDLMWLGITGAVMYLLSSIVIHLAGYLQRRGLFPGTAREVINLR